ncbi:hypothetical protein [Streptomyces sp. NPDC047869]|uniref:hypothetical protein n=1 Tax=Streptomyces sp. NPDC047869 TaxID=3154709 RepID=UPI0034520464
METDCTSDMPAPLPTGTRLLHIGPHKTGTTAVQGALFAARDRLPEHGVVFPAHSRHPMEAALAACARPAMMGDTVPTERHWTRLPERVRATGEKTSVISSEFFADAPDDATAARIVEQLGGDRVHVLVTLRPLARIMPSQWQQYVQNGLRMGYEDWLEHMLRRPPYDEPNPSFWRRHRHDRLVARWVRAAGSGRVTVVVVDDRDRGGLMRTFEALLGLPENLLWPVPDTANRSLTLAETEMLRNLNVEFRDNGLPDELYSRLVRNGAVMHMKNMCSPTPADVRIATPPLGGRGSRRDRRLGGGSDRRPRCPGPRRSGPAVHGARAAGTVLAGAPDDPGSGGSGAVRRTRGCRLRERRRPPRARCAPDAVEGARPGPRSPLPETAGGPLNTPPAGACEGPVDLLTAIPRRFTVAVAQSPGAQGE